MSRTRPWAVRSWFLIWPDGIRDEKARPDGQRRVTRAEAQGHHAVARQIPVNGERSNDPHLYGIKRIENVIITKVVLAFVQAYEEASLGSAKERTPRDTPGVKISD